VGVSPSIEELAIGQIRRCHLLYHNPPLSVYNGQLANYQSEQTDSIALSLVVARAMDRFLAVG
jgi:hypothetical protein